MDTQQPTPVKKKRTEFDRQCERCDRLQRRIVHLYHRGKTFSETFEVHLEYWKLIQESDDWQKAQQWVRRHLEGYQSALSDIRYREQLVWMMRFDGEWLDPEQVKAFFEKNPGRSYAENTGGTNFWKHSRKPYYKETIDAEATQATQP